MGLIFGNIDNTETYSHMVKFICADFAREERRE